MGSPDFEVNCQTLDPLFGLVKVIWDGYITKEFYDPIIYRSFIWWRTMLSIPWGYGATRSLLSICMKLERLKTLWLLLENGDGLITRKVWLCCYQHEPGEVER